MKKKVLFIFLALTLLALPLLAACEAAENGEEEEFEGTIELTVANFFSAKAGQSTLLEEFCLELEERTDGRVQVEYLTGGALLGPADMLQGVIDGTADIGYSHVFYTPDRFPITEGLGLPLGYTTAWVGGHVMNDFMEEFGPLEEWDGLEILWMNATDPSAINTRDTPVRTLEDMQGLVLRAPGLVGEIVSALGATPIGLPMTEVYDAVAKGEIDGDASNWETLFAFKFAEVDNYSTSIWQITHPYPFFCVMNGDVYNDLPKDIRKIFDALVGEYKERSQLMWNHADYLGKMAGDAEGVEFITLSDAEVAKFVAAVEPVIDDWIAKMVDAGYSQAEVESWIDFVRERIEFWTARQVAWHIKSAIGPEEVLD